MKNKDTSITNEDSAFNLSDTGLVSEKSTYPRAFQSVALLGVMLSFYALSGSPTTINNHAVEFNMGGNIISITDFQNIEKKIKKRDYSFITARGGKEHNIVYTNTIY